MNETRHSLLLRAQTGEEKAWKDLTELYRPLILGWLNRQGVPAADPEDLGQDALLSTVKHLPAFEHSGHRGVFRPYPRRHVDSPVKRLVCQARDPFVHRLRASYA